METINRIRAFDTKSSQIRKYAVTREVTSSAGDFTFHRAVNGNIWSASETFGENEFRLSNEAGRRTLSRLLTFPAVESVRLRSMELHVQIGSAYDFKDAEDDIIAIIIECLFEGAEVEVQMEAGTLQSQAEKEVLAFDREFREFFLCNGSSDAFKNLEKAEEMLGDAKNCWLTERYPAARSAVEKGRFYLQLARQANL